MAYTPFIYLDFDTEERLKSLLDDELNRHYAERSPWIDDLKKAQFDYWAKSTTEKATFPFTGASQLIIPLGAITVEAIMARVYTQLFALKQFVTAKARTDEWGDAEDDVANMMDFVMRHEMNIYDTLQSPILEIIKFGNGICKPTYERIVKTGVRYIGDQEQEYDVVVKDGPALHCTPLSRFLMPFADKDPQFSLWCGEELSESPYTVKLLEESGFFYPETFEKLGTWISQSQTGVMGQEREVEKDQDKLEKREAVWPKLLDFFEISLAFDTNGSGYQKEIVVHYHRGARLLMSCRYNSHADLHRPYRIGKYIPLEHRWTAIGVMKQVEQFQKEITTQHRQRLDNATLANIKMIKVSKMSGYGPREPIFPGKMWFLNDMEHIDTFSLGEINESSFGNEQATIIYHQQRSGINELNLGMPQAGTPGTASSDLARIQEGRLKFDFVYNNIKQMINQVIKDTAANLQQYGPKTIAYYDYVGGADKARRFFEMRPDLITDGVLMELSSAGQQENKLLDRQNWKDVSQNLAAYYQGVIQLGQLIGEENLVKVIAIQGIEASTEAMKQLLETFNIRNMDRILLTKVVEMLKGTMNGSQQPPAIAAGSNGSQSINPTQGMGSPNQIIQTA